MKLSLPRFLSVALPMGALSGLALAGTKSGDELVPAHPPASGRATAAPSSGSTQPLIATCLPAIKDQSGAGCLQASSIPTLGDLYPMSPNLNVDAGSGNVGVGTTFPFQTLTVNGSAMFGPAENIGVGIDANFAARLGFVKKFGYGPTIACADQEAITFHHTDQSDILSNIGGAVLREDMRINPDGAVGIGTSFPAAAMKLHVAGAMRVDGGGQYIANTSILGASTALELKPNASTAGWNFNLDSFGGAPGLYLSEANVNFSNLVLRRGGNVGVGTAFPQQLLDVAGNVRCVSLIQTSAREFKQDIAPLTGALESILKLQGVTYSWNDKAPEAVQGHEDIGFIADDVDAVLPEIVSKDESGKVLGLDYGKITPVAVEAIKELNAKNVELSAMNVALEARLARLEALFAGQTK